MSVSVTRKARKTNRSGRDVDAPCHLQTPIRAALDGRDYVIPDDVKALAIPALRHRLVLSPAAEIEGRRVEQVLAGLVDQVAAPR